MGGRPIVTTKPGYKYILFSFTFSLGGHLFTSMASEEELFHCTLVSSLRFRYPCDVVTSATTPTPPPSNEFY